MFISVNINNKIIEMEIDSGTYYTVMSEEFVKKNFKNILITKAFTNLRGYEDNTMEPRGQLKDLKVTLNDKTKFLSCLVLRGEKMPLIGRQWLSEFELWPLKLLSDSDRATNNQNIVQKLHAIDVSEKLITEFRELFSNTAGVYNKREITLHVQPNTKPIALAARRVPYALKPKVEKELERLQNAGHLEKVDASEWATPIVPILKNKGDIRICGDFKLTLNSSLIVTKRPFPRINDIFEVLRRGLTYSQLDLPHAYMQIPVAVESRKFLTITTHVGLFRYKNNII